MAATVWRGRLSFGMVSIPIRLYKAARRERIRFHHVYRRAEPPPEPLETEAPEEPAPVSAPPKIHELRTALPGSDAQASVARVRNLPAVEESDAALDKPAVLDKAEVLKGYEIEKGRYVTFERKELASLRPQTSTELAIAEFVRIQEIDSIFFDSSYYASPDPGGEKPYALLYQALAETEYAAIGSLAMHGREHAIVIRPGRRGLIAQTLFYAHEVNAEQEYPAGLGLVAPQELELAKLLVRRLAAKFEPAKLKDTFEERLRQSIESRAEFALPGVDRPGPARRAPVVDIMEALRKSLEATRKPPERAAGKMPKPRARRSRA